MFKKATKKQAKLRIALDGPSGSGKTYSALEIAKYLGDKPRIAFIDTERGSASKYSGEFDFDVVELESFSPGKYIEAIRAAEDEGYDVLIIDSLSHAWIGKDGALEQVDRKAAQSASKSSFNAWRDVTPQHNKLVDAILGAKMHVIATMRVKVDYDMQNGKPVKQGLAAIQREGMEYEFDACFRINMQHIGEVSKTRCKDLDGYCEMYLGKDLAKKLIAWVSDGAPVADPQDDPEYQRLSSELVATMVKLGTQADKAVELFNKNFKRMSTAQLAEQLDKAQAKLEETAQAAA